MWAISPPPRQWLPASCYSTWRNSWQLRTKSYLISAAAGKGSKTHTHIHRLGQANVLVIVRRFAASRQGRWLRSEGSKLRSALLGNKLFCDVKPCVAELPRYRQAVSLQDTRLPLIPSLLTWPSMEVRADRPCGCVLLKALAKKRGNICRKTPATVVASDPYHWRMGWWYQNPTFQLQSLKQSDLWNYATTSQYCATPVRLFMSLNKEWLAGHKQKLTRPLLPWQQQKWSHWLLPR